MYLQARILLAIQALAVYAATNEPCYGPDSSPGVCVSTTACKEASGKSHTGACMGNARGSGADPGNIQCCVKPSCTDSGACLWESDCGGKTTSSQCPGPGAFSCCSSLKSVFGTHKTPSVPTSNCAAVSEKGAKAVMKEFPGRTRVLYCYAGDDPSSDHYTGMAIDFMISDAGGDATIGGREVAEWVMRNRKDLNLKYVIWGQRIWSNEAGSSDKEVGWPAWRNLGDRESIDGNHWDHVHVSFK